MLVTILADSREQQSLSFSENIAVERKGLSVGDYSLAGFENIIAIERKSLNDLVATIILERERFKRELERAKKLEFFCIVAECSLEDIYAKNYTNDIHPNAVIGAITSIIVEYKTPIFFAGSRIFAAKFIEDLLMKFEKKYLETCPEIAAKPRKKKDVILPKEFS